ncbi:MAG: hypothetical protein KF873_12240 [Gemmataceae bacterium]|nr:hypothetical protein [Gemmataceae bacterium]
MGDGIAKSTSVDDRKKSDSETNEVKNVKTARKFLESRVPKSEVDSHLEGIKRNERVEVVTLKRGQVLQRYDFPNTKSTVNPGGMYFTEPGTSVQKTGTTDVGVSKPSDRKLDLFIVREDVQALKSTAADYGRPAKGFNDAGLLYQGGGTQYFVGKNDLQKIERIVHKDHAVNASATPAAANVDAQRAKSQRLASAARERGTATSMSTTSKTASQKQRSASAAQSKSTNTSIGLRKSK